MFFGIESLWVCFPFNFLIFAFAFCFLIYLFIFIFITKFDSQGEGDGEVWTSDLRFTRRGLQLIVLPPWGFIFVLFYVIILASGN